MKIRGPERASILASKAPRLMISAEISRRIRIESARYQTSVTIMTLRCNPTNSRIAALAATALLLNGCSGKMNIWPLGGDKTGGEKSTERSNATTVNPGEYLCNAGKRFTVRTVDGGKAVWLVLPEREVRLDKGDTGNRYSSGNTLLELNGSEATLSDGTATVYAGCKLPDAAKPAK